MQEPVRLLAAALAAIAALLPAVAQEPAEAERPNIVFILMDNLGYGEVGVYGGGIIARRADAARSTSSPPRALRLTNFNVEAQCTPSRSAIMTGRFSIRSGTHSVPIGGGARGTDAVGSDDRRAAVRRRLRHRRLRQVAPRQRGRPAAQRPGLRRVVRHPAHDRRGVLAVDAAGWPPACRSSTSWRAARARRAANLTSTTSSSAAADRCGDHPAAPIDFMKRSVAGGQAVLRLRALTRWCISRRCRTRISPGKTGYGDFPDCPRRDGRATSARSSMPWRNSGSATTPSSSSPATTGRRRPGPGRARRGRGAATTSPHMEGSLRAPFIIRWPGRIPAGRVSNEIVHEVDTFTTFATIAGAEVPWTGRSIGRIRVHRDARDPSARPQDHAVVRRRAHRRFARRARDADGDAPSNPRRPHRRVRAAH